MADCEHVSEFQQNSVPWRNNNQY